MKLLESMNFCNFYRLQRWHRWKVLACSSTEYSYTNMSVLKKADFSVTYMYMYVFS